MSTAHEAFVQARETMTVSRVYGQPIQQNGFMVIPAATVRGGGGGGDGESDKGRGSGGGFGVSATPVGAFVVDDAGVRWRPALDWTRIIVMTEALAIVALLVYRSVSRRGVP